MAATVQTHKGGSDKCVRIRALPDRPSPTPRPTDPVPAGPRTRHLAVGGGEEVRGDGGGAGEAGGGGVQMKSGAGGAGGSGADLFGEEEGQAE